MTYWSGLFRLFQVITDVFLGFMGYGAGYFVITVTGSSVSCNRLIIIYITRLNWP